MGNKGIPYYSILLLGPDGYVPADTFTAYDSPLAMYLLTGEGGDEIVAPADSKFPPLTDREREVATKYGGAILIPAFENL